MAPAHLGGTLKVPCWRTWDSGSVAVHRKGAMQAHMGPLVNCGALLGCRAHAYAALGHHHPTLKLPCMLTLGMWSPALLPQGAI